MNQHINKTACVTFHHIGRLRKVRSILGAEITASLVTAFSLSRLDYCNAMLASLHSVFSKRQPDLPEIYVHRIM